MSEPDSAASASAGLIISVQFLKDLSFENPNAPQVLVKTREKPEMQLGVDVRSRQVASSHYEIMLAIEAKATFDGTVGFIVELEYCGLCAKPDVPDEDLERFLLTEGPRQLFPFARSILADATREGGYPPLYLTPVDFDRLYEARRAKTEEQTDTKAEAEVETEVETESAEA